MSNQRSQGGFGNEQNKDKNKEGGMGGDRDKERQQQTPKGKEFPQKDKNQR